MIDSLDLMLRLAIATSAGVLVGVERETRGQFAGMRTHALVAIGAALFTIAGAYGFPENLRSIAVDPMRVAAQVASGIGFIGAGVIIRDRGSVRGITTAAGLWASAGIGMAAGAGLFTTVLGGVLAVLFTLVALRFLREVFLRRLTQQNQSIMLSYRMGHGTLAPVISAVERAGGHIRGLHIDDEDGTRQVVLQVRVRDHSLFHRLVDAIATRPEVLSIDFE